MTHRRPIEVSQQVQLTALRPLWRASVGREHITRSAVPFGHGLSYTTFNITAANVASNNAGGYSVKATVRNTGGKSGSEVVQVYLGLPASASSLGAIQPPKRLAGFQKVELAAGATQEVTINIDPAAAHHPISVWNKATNAWVTPPGQYTVFAGKSSAPKDLLTAGSFSK